MYILLIIFAAVFIRIFLIALAVYAVRIIEINRIAASFSRIRVFTARYAPKTVRRLLFWRVSSFLLIILRAVSILYGVYHTNAPNVIAGLITKEYTNLAILKLAFYINIKIWLIARFYVANFFLILIIYSPYFNLKSTYISNTLI